MVERIKEKFGEELVNVAIAHALSPDQRDELLAYAKENLNIAEIVEGNIGSVIGTNTGPGVIAIVAHKKIV